VNRSMQHIESCQEDDCETCDHLLNFYMTCDGCLSVGHMDSYGWYMDEKTQLVYCMHCAEERRLIEWT